MDSTNLQSHISRQFNADLDQIRQRVLAMGGLIEQQIHGAISALCEGNRLLGEEVIRKDTQVNAFEVMIDEECNRILARRQPTASDLRLIVAVIKTITDLERIGDEAEKVARMATDLASIESSRIAYPEVEHMGKHVAMMVHDTLDAFARMDSEIALKIVQEDIKVDREYEAIMRQCMTFMMEDPRTIRRVLDVMWSVRALERIGDHAKNIAEYVIYFVHGKDVRHISVEDLEKEMRGK